MAIKAGRVLRTATAAARKFQRNQISATSSASTATPPVSPSSGVGTFLGIPKIPRSESDMLVCKYIRLYQRRLVKKGDFTEAKLTKMLSGGNTIGIGETIKLLEGRKSGTESSKKPNSLPSTK